MFTPTHFTTFVLVVTAVVFNLHAARLPNVYQRQRNVEEIQLTDSPVYEGPGILSNPSPIMIPQSEHYVIDVNENSGEINNQGEVQWEEIDLLPEGQGSDTTDYLDAETNNAVDGNEVTENVVNFNSIEPVNVLATVDTSVQTVSGSSTNVTPARRVCVVCILLMILPITAFFTGGFFSGYLMNQFLIASGRRLEGVEKILLVLVGFIGAYISLLIGTIPLFMHASLSRHNPDTEKAPRLLHPATKTYQLSELSQEQLANDCAICLEKLSELEGNPSKTLAETCPGHFFHQDCLLESYKHSNWLCPLCRKDYDATPIENDNQV